MTSARGKRTPTLFRIEVRLEKRLIHFAAAVNQLSSSDRPIAADLKPLGQQQVAVGRMKLGTVVGPDSSLGWQQATKYGSARWIAGWSQAVRVRKKHASLCESIDVGRSCLRMPAQAPNPVIQVIDGNEQDVDLLRMACKSKQW